MRYKFNCSKIRMNRRRSSKTISYQSDKDKSDNRDYQRSADGDEMLGLQLEYTAIRDEALLLMEEYNNQLMNVFVVGVAFLSLVYTVQKPQLFSLTYLIMIPLQILINNKAYMLARCGAYIKTVLKPRIKGLHWESMMGEADNQFNKEYKISIGKFDIEHSFCVYGTFLFCLISLLSYFSSCVSVAIASNGMLTARVYLPWLIGIFLGLVLTFIDFKLCKKGFNFREVKAKYEVIIKKILIDCQDRNEERENRNEEDEELHDDARAYNRRKRRKMRENPQRK